MEKRKGFMMRKTISSIRKKVFEQELHSIMVTIYEC